LFELVKKLVVLVDTCTVLNIHLEYGKFEDLDEVWVQLSFELSGSQDERRRNVYHEQTPMGDVETFKPIDVAMQYSRRTKDMMLQT
jgi:hypothetical protein